MAQSAQPLYPMWIGLQHSKYSTKSNPWFVWQDGRYASFTKFLAGEPADYDACIGWKTTKENSGWKSLGCNYEQPFVCKQKAAGCPSSTYTAQSGTLTSSNYPDNYENNLICYYHIRVPQNYTISLTLTDLETESGRDILSIYDGDEAESDKIASVSGMLYYQEKKQFDSSENNMTLVFRTDYSVTKRGWSLDYKAVLGHKNIIFETPTGVLSSPNYPKNYPSNFNQVYKIIVGPDSRIKITITDFRTETRYDYLKIVEGPSIDSKDPPLALLSGIKQTPIVITSSTNQVTLRFLTDPYIQFSGYNLKWESIPLEL